MSTYMDTLLILTMIYDVHPKEEKYGGLERSWDRPKVIKPAGGKIRSYTSNSWHQVWNCVYHSQKPRISAPGLLGESLMDTDTDTFFIDWSDPKIDQVTQFSSSREESGY